MSRSDDTALLAQEVARALGVSDERRAILHDYWNFIAKSHRDRPHASDVHGQLNSKFLSEIWSVDLNRLGKLIYSNVPDVVRATLSNLIVFKATRWFDEQDRMSIDALRAHFHDPELHQQALIALAQDQFHGAHFPDAIFLRKGGVSFDYSLLASVLLYPAASPSIATIPRFKRTIRPPSGPHERQYFVGWTSETNKGDKESELLLDKTIAVVRSLRTELASSNERIERLLASMRPHLGQPRPVRSKRS
jgi:hypothetical protein